MDNSNYISHIHQENISSEAKSRTKKNTETSHREISKGIKEKVKLPGSDPDSPPIDVIDYTKEKRPT